MSPLIAHVSVMIFENSQIHNREEEILYWIDELHVMENELKKVSLIFNNRIILFKLSGYVSLKHIIGFVLIVIVYLT